MSVKRIPLSSPDIKGVIVASMDGQHLASALPPGMDEGLAASTTVELYLSAERNLTMGDMGEVLLKGRDGYMLSLKAGSDAVLTAYLDINSRLGLVMLDLKRAATEIAKFLILQKPFKILLLGKDIDDSDYELPYPSVFKPPSPPGDLGRSGQAQLKRHTHKEDLGDKPYCKNCGSIISEGQSICHVCKKKVI